tara:strand:+ start:977 stop:1114 length:138 start_codon:yes stop_codon:yes gene_type:complete
MNKYPKLAFENFFSKSSEQTFGVWEPTHAEFDDAGDFSEVDKDSK